MDVINESIANDCNLIITHHPLIFHPIKSLDFQKDKNSLLIQKLIKNDLTLFSAHTNLDFTKNGVSFQLAKTLGLKDIDFLVKLDANQCKLSVFVPEDYVEAVAEAIFNAGGGIIGDYSRCSFRTDGAGTFLGSNESSPFTGKPGKREKVNEAKLEVLVNSWKIKDVVAAVHDSHPYEEPAYDIYPLKNKNVNYGMGALGELNEDMSPKEFLKHVSVKLGAEFLRYTAGRNERIKKIAVCGGAGSELLREAAASGADAFITADIKYHAFHDASGKILLIDAGHYETEIYVLGQIEKELKAVVKNEFKIYKYSGSTNPVIFYNN
jgi:dinuclear metal center YbgI/SA1388 family protein